MKFKTRISFYSFEYSIFGYLKVRFQAKDDCTSDVIINIIFNKELQ